MKILIVDDEAANVEYLNRVLKGYETREFTDPGEALKSFSKQPTDIVIADQKMPGYTGIETIKEMRKRQDDFIGIIVSAYTDIPDLVEAVNSNIIYKYIVKPFSPDTLKQHVKRAIEALELRRENSRLTKALQKENIELRNLTQNPLEAFIGFHPAVEKVKELARMYANSDFPVLISGETGTGKELIARAIHTLSVRSAKKFIAVNCSAFSEQLLESELFGYKKGAFTGAVKDKKGFILEAAGGTLFLDEIGDFPYALQAKVLRFIQFGTFYPVGSTEEEYVDVRIVSATNQNLKERVLKKTFRSDLLFRINALSITIPPLRERKSDILYILESLAVRRGINLPDFTEGSKQLLLDYSFPGNVRELESILEKIHLHSETHKSELISEEFLFECIQPRRKEKSGENHFIIDVPGGGEDFSFSLQNYLDEIERKIILKYFEKNNYNITRTADEVGVSRQGLKNKFRRYGIPFGNSKDQKREQQ